MSLSFSVFDYPLVFGVFLPDLLIFWPFYSSSLFSVAYSFSLSLFVFDDPLLLLYLPFSDVTVEITVYCERLTYGWECISTLPISIYFETAMNINPVLNAS